MSKSIWHRYDEAQKHQDIIMTDTGCWAYRADLLALETENKDLSDKIGKLETELDRTRKALGYAIYVIQTVAKMSDKLSREYGETLVEQLDNIQAYCWQEGYVLTHEEDLEKAITALEQKD